MAKKSKDVAVNHIADAVALTDKDLAQRVSDAQSALTAVEIEQKKAFSDMMEWDVTLLESTREFESRKAEGTLSEQAESLALSMLDEATERRDYLANVEIPAYQQNIETLSQAVERLSALRRQLEIQKFRENFTRNQPRSPRSIQSDDLKAITAEAKTLSHTVDALIELRKGQ